MAMAAISNRIGVTTLNKSAIINNAETANNEAGEMSATKASKLKTS
jgi:hypothetical protein